MRVRTQHKCDLALICHTVHEQTQSNIFCENTQAANLLAYDVHYDDSTMACSNFVRQQTFRHNSIGVRSGEQSQMHMIFLVEHCGVFVFGSVLAAFR